MPKDITPDEIEALRSQLQERLSVLVEEFRRELDSQADENYADLSAQVRDLGDEAAADVLMDSRLFDIQRDADEMRDIREALARMQDRTYGTCMDCGEPIAVERLRAQPAASRCLRCQARYEHEHETVNHREI